MRGWIKKPWASLAGKQYTASQIALAAQDDGGLLANQTPTCARARSETLSFGSVKVQPMLLARLRATINKPASTCARRVVCTPCLLVQEGQRIAVCLILRVIELCCGTCTWRVFLLSTFVLGRQEYRNCTRPSASTFVLGRQEYRKCTRPSGPSVPVFL